MSPTMLFLLTLLLVLRQSGFCSPTLVLPSRSLVIKLPRVNATIPCSYTFPENVTTITWTLGGVTGDTVLQKSSDGTVEPGSGYEGLVSFGEGCSLVFKCASLVKDGNYTITIHHKSLSSETVRVVFVVENATTFSCDTRPVEEGKGSEDRVNRTCPVCAEDNGYKDRFCSLLWIFFGVMLPLVLTIIICTIANMQVQRSLERLSGQLGFVPSDETPPFQQEEEPSDEGSDEHNLQESLLGQSDTTSRTSNVAEGTGGSGNVAEGTGGSCNMAEGTGGSGNVAEGTGGSVNVAERTDGSCNMAEGTGGSGNVAEETSGSANVAEGTGGSCNMAEGTGGSGNVAEGTGGSCNAAEGTDRSGNVRNETGGLDNATDGTGNN